MPSIGMYTDFLLVINYSMVEVLVVHYIYDTMVQIFSITEFISSLTQAFALSSTRASSGVWENANVYNRQCCYRKFYS